MKEDYDGAEPTASSIAVMNVLVLSHLLEDGQWAERIERTLRLFGARLDQIGRAVPMMAAALSAYTAGMQQIMIVGDAGRDVLERAVAAKYRPFAIALSLTTDEQVALARLASWSVSMRPIDGRAAAYVCRHFSCERPVVRPRRVDPTPGAQCLDKVRLKPDRTYCEDPVNVSVDVWLRGQDFATTRKIEGVLREPPAWTDEDVRAVLHGMLLEMHRAKHPDPDDSVPSISLRGLSWIVNCYEEGGVVIAIEITMALPSLDL